MNPWARSVIGGFNWGGAQPAPAKPDEDEKEDKPDGAGKPPAAPRPRQAAAAHAQAAQPNMFQEHAAMQANMYGATAAAWQREHDSRVEQAREARKQQHEYEIEMLRQQGAAQRAAAEPAYGATPSDAARQARNRSLLGMAGLGGYRIQNGKRTPHPYQSPLAKSMLG